MKKDKVLLLLVLCSLSCSFVGSISNIIGVYYNPVSEALSIKRGTLALYSTIIQIVSSFFTIILKKIANNKNFKSILVISGIACGISYMLMGICTNIYQIYGLSVIVGIFASSVTLSNISILINSNFDDNIGFYSGLIFAFCGIAGTLLSKLISFIIGDYGYKIGYIVNGIVYILCFIPALFVRMNYTQSTSNEVKKDTDMKMVYWLCLLSVFLNTPTAFPQHFVGSSIEKGFDADFGSSVLSMAMIGNIVFKLIIGKMTDKLGSKTTIFVMKAVSIVTIIAYMFSNNSFIILVSGFCMGVNYGIASVLGSCFSKEILKDSFADYYPLIGLCGMIVFGAFLTVYGYVFDFTKSYYPDLVFMIIIDVACCILTNYLDKKNKSEIV